MLLLPAGAALRFADAIGQLCVHFMLFSPFCLSFLQSVITVVGQWVSTTGAGSACVKRLTSTGLLWWWGFVVCRPVLGQEWFAGVTRWKTAILNSGNGASLAKALPPSLLTPQTFTGPRRFRGNFAHHEELLLLKIFSGRSLFLSQSALFNSCIPPYPL